MKYLKFFAALFIVSSIMVLASGFNDKDEQEERSDGTTPSISADVSSLTSSGEGGTYVISVSATGDVPQSAKVGHEGPGSDNIMKILAIGNSFSEDAVEQNLYELFTATGIEAVIGNLYIGGCSLETHYHNAVENSASYSYRKIVDGKKTTTANKTMLSGILDEDWDYISLQQSSPLSGMYETYETYLPYLVQYVRENATNSDMEVAFHQTWAYATNSTHDGLANYGNDQMTMYYAIMNASSSAVTDNGINILIPSGTAIQNGRNTWMGDTFNSDGYHLEYTYGRFTAACTWFETFSGIDVTTTTYTPDDISDEIKDLVTHAAHYAVESPYEINPMTNWQ